MIELAAKLVERCKQLRIRLVVAESCTGGLISSAITDIPGSSKVFDCGFVTYSYESKNTLLGIPMETITRNGVVSPIVAELMASGALQHSHADIAVAITGIAGPGGGTLEKPVGLVFFATAYKGKVQHYERRFVGNRDEVRQQAGKFALQLLLDALNDNR
jgi:nicotinamide-nucleotide amidase